MDPLDSYLAAQVQARSLASQIADPGKALRSSDRSFRLGQIDSVDFATNGTTKPILTVDGRTMRCVANPDWLPEAGDVVIFIENVGDPIAVWALDPPAVGVWVRLWSTTSQLDIAVAANVVVAFQSGVSSGGSLTANTASNRIDLPANDGADGIYAVSARVYLDNDGSLGNGWRSVEVEDSSGREVVRDQRTDDGANRATVLNPASSAVHLFQARTWLRVLAYASNHSGTLDITGTTNQYSLLHASRVGLVP